MRRSIFACGLLLAFAGLTTAAAAAVGSGTARATAGTNPATTTTTTTTTATRAATTSIVKRPGGHAIAYWTRHIRRSRAGTRRWLAVIHGGPAMPSASRRTCRRTRSHDSLSSRGCGDTASTQPGGAPTTRLRSLAGPASTSTREAGRIPAGRITAACRWTCPSRRRTAAGCSAIGGRRITGARSSRSGLPCALRACGASRPGRARRITAACTKHSFRLFRTIHGPRQRAVVILTSS